MGTGLLWLPWLAAAALAAWLGGWQWGLGALALGLLAQAQAGCRAGRPPVTAAAPDESPVLDSGPGLGASLDDEVLRRLDVALLVLDGDLIIRAANAAAALRLGLDLGRAGAAPGLAEYVRDAKVLDLARQGVGEVAAGDLRCRAWKLPREQRDGGVLMALYPEIPGAAADQRAAEELEALKHEVRNPLGALGARLELARDEASGEAREHLDAALLAQQRLADLLRTMERPEEDAMTPQQVRGALDDAARRARAHGLALEGLDAALDGPGPEHRGSGPEPGRSDPGGEIVLPPLRGARSDLVLALDNLLDNARRYGGGRARLEFALVGAPSGAGGGGNGAGDGAAPGAAFLRLGLRDDGRGIEDAEVDAIFDSGYRTARAQREFPGQGRGAGLYLARRAARRWGGDLRVASAGRASGGQSPWIGAHFELLWPVHRPEP